jgi:hypothetical protein
MCTVTYIPGQANTYILSSSRDEAPERAAASIVERENHGLRLWFPRDAGAGGSWIVMADTGTSLCILNGAFELHARNPPYRRSRGLMALDFFEFPDAGSFRKHYEFGGIEPFTMLIVQAGRLYDLRWDGSRLHHLHPDARKRHIWSSATLYGPEDRALREKWFATWLEERPDARAEDMLDFHRQAGDGDPRHDVVMNRNGVVRTTSITQIRQDGHMCRMRYEALLYNFVDEKGGLLRREMVG